MSRNYFTKKNRNVKCVLTVCFSSKISLYTFNNFLKKIKFLNFKVKVKTLKPKIQFVSILKSPHINKIAQEQFHKSKIICIYNFESISNYNNFYLLFKKLKKTCFADIDIKYKTIYSSKLFAFQKLVLSKNFFFKTFNVNTYLALLDSSGELLKYSLK